MATDDQSDVAALRCDQPVSGVTTGVLTRVFIIASMIWVVRIVVHELGQQAWAALATAAAAFELAVVCDGATSDLATYESARAPTRAQLVHSLDQVLMLSIAPAVFGALCLCGAALFASHEEGQLLATLLLINAAAFPVFTLGNVYAGTLQGLGWIRDINMVNLALAVGDFVVLVVGAESHWSLPTIQLVRAVRLILRPILLVALVRARGLPIAALARPHWDTLIRLARYAIPYAVSRFLGQVIYRAPIVIAPLVGLPLEHCATLVIVDQVAAVAYRFSHVAYESLLPRLTWAFGAGLQAERDNYGGRLYLAASLALAAIVVPFGVGISIGGRWLFDVWLDRELVYVETLFPLMVAAWIFNACGSPSTCVLNARGLTNTSAKIHFLVVVLHAALGLWLVPVMGIVGVAVATTVANFALFVGLSVAGSWAASLTQARLFRYLTPMLVMGALLAGLARYLEDSSLWLAILGGAVSLAVCGALLASSKDVKTVWMRGRYYARVSAG